MSYRQQSEEFYQVLQECKLPVKHHVYDNIPHAGFVVDWLDKDTATQVSKSLISSTFGLCLLLYVLGLVTQLKHCKPCLSLQAFARAAIKCWPGSHQVPKLTFAC